MTHSTTEVEGVRPVLRKTTEFFYGAFNLEYIGIPSLDAQYKICVY